MLKDEESRREDGDIDIEVHNKLTIRVVSCPLFEAFDCVTAKKVIHFNLLKSVTSPALMNP